MTKFLVILSVFVSGSAFAQVPNFEMRLRNVEQKTYQLEQQNQNLTRRVWDLEQYIYNNPNPPPAPNAIYMCAVENTASYRVYLGRSRSKTEAEAIAKNACSSASLNPQYCYANECSIENNYSRTCRITHTVNKRDFLGHGKSLTEAKAVARNACGSASVSPQFCDVQTLACD